MKKRLAIVMIMLFILSLFPTHTAAAAIKISKSKATMEIDSTLTLKLSGTKSKVAWKSSKDSVAKVDSKGAVTAKKVGTTTISATINKKQYSCIINVVNSNQKEMTAKKGTVTELSTGIYVVGEDFPAGKYNVKTLSGSGNFFVEGNDIYVNEIMAEEGHELWDTHTYSNLKLLYGDEIEIRSGVVLEFTKLN
jgi:hypothetical protein